MTALWWARIFYLLLLVLAAGAFTVFQIFRDDETEMRRR